MKDLLKKLPEIALLVVLLTVVSFRSDKIFCEDIKPDSEESRFKIEDARAFFPEAKKIKEKSIDLAVVKGKKGKKLGKLLCTSPLSDDIIGYAGTVPVMIAVDRNDVIKGIKLMPNVESPGFIRRIRKKGFFNSWDGMPVDTALVKEVDAISGASMTTNAVKQGIKLRLEKYAKRVVEKKSIDYMKILYYLGSIFVIGLALISFFYPGKLKKFRILLLLSSILILGLWQGNFISLALLYGWFLNGVPLVGKIILISIVLLAILVPLFTSKSFYCVYVCPYGAAQELAGKITKKKISLPQKLGKILRKVRMVFFYVIVLMLVVGIDPDLTEYEPFSAFLFNAATPWVISIAVIFLILSILTPRAWCNYFCPTGYLLDVFRKGKKIKK
jgi:Na+-translocating ferredoxin:NAD+ oxidoreductase RnfG subunit